MKLPGICSRECEVKELLQAGRWPAAAAAEVLAHVTSCRACRELVLVTQTLQRERAFVARAARLEAPGVLWWRAQLRRRNAALQTISRPLLGAQIFAVAVSLFAALLYLAAEFGNHADAGLAHGWGWLSWLASLPGALHLESLLPAPLQSPLAIVGMIVGMLAVVGAISGAFAYATSEKH